MSLQQSGAERRVRDAALSKCKKIEQNGNDLPAAGAVAVWRVRQRAWKRIRVWKDAHSFPNQGRRQRVAQLEHEAGKVWNS